MFWSKSGGLKFLSGVHIVDRRLLCLSPDSRFRYGDGGSMATLVSPTSTYEGSFGHAFNEREDEVKTVFIALKCVARHEKELLGAKRIADRKAQASLSKPTKQHWETPRIGRQSFRSGHTNNGVLYAHASPFHFYKIDVSGPT